MLSQLCKTFLHPRAIAFLPVFVVHIPAYVTGWLASRYLTVPEEEESKAQFKAIFGGLGLCCTHSAIIVAVLNALAKLGKRGVVGGTDSKFDAEILEKLGRLVAGSAVSASFKELLGPLVVTVGTPRLLWKWHNALVGGNLRQ
ncbi:hypothetical protein F5I97DRAFT_34720 [Phlebopus sp. FC_14]|nr:hypothetical protein F5I97DRAFT_34720 [Phlebopus sp. FC_14]